MVIRVKKTCTFFLAADLIYIKNTIKRFFFVFLQTLKTNKSKPMKHIIITFTLLLPLLMTGCSKDYFSELKHPLEIQGSFDPVYGFPLAKMSADMATLVGMVDTNQAITVFVGEDDVVSLRYDYYEHTVLSWVAEKGKTTKGDSKTDTLHSYTVINGTEYIDIFEKLQDYDTGTLRINEFYVNLEADVQGFVNNSFQEVLAEGCNLTFDSLVLKINCLDGYTETLPLLIATEKVNVNQLLATKHLPLLKDYNLRHVVEHKPTSVEYTLRLCITIPDNQMAPGSTFQEQINYIGVDSIAADINARLELPLNFYSRNIRYVDTVDLDLSKLEEQLRNIDQDTLRGENYTVHLNDTNCYLAFVVGNGLPLGMNIDITFLDQNDAPILSTVFDGRFEIQPSPVAYLPGHENTYVSNGSTPSQFKTHLTLENLRQLSNSRRMVYDINISTSRSGHSGGMPFIAIRNNDRLDIRSYVVLSPHADFNIPVDLTDLPFFK